MDIDKYPSKGFQYIKQIVLIDTENDCLLFENIFKYFPNSINIHLDLNHINNPTLKHWDPFINRLGMLKYLQELILNNCGFSQIKLPDQGILQNSIYELNQIENESAKQMSIAHLLNLTHLSRVLINRDKSQRVKIDYLQRYAQDYFDKN
ncbi:unnamed protein product [Rotaria sp. Silwood2]|nr:unnamed protein product [Rotaria sp. Silwood2]CAF4653654.1 unnamed protein product [Rotaria sp. Silwood2]